MGSLELHQSILPGLVLTVGIVLAIAETLELGTRDKPHRGRNIALGALLFLAIVTSLYQPGGGSVMILHCTLFWVLNVVWMEVWPHLAYGRKLGFLPGVFSGGGHFVSYHMLLLAPRPSCYALRICCLLHGIMGPFPGR